MNLPNYIKEITRCVYTDNTNPDVYHFYYSKHVANRIIEAKVKTLSEWFIKNCGAEFHIGPVYTGTSEKKMIFALKLSAEYRQLFIENFHPKLK